MNPKHEDDVPASGALISLVQVLRNAAVLYRSESIMAREMAMPAPLDYFARCEDLFYTTYAHVAQRAGIALNRVTFEAMLSAEMPDAVLHVAYKDLPKQWVFNPYRGCRHA